MKIATAFALLALVAVLSFTTDTGRAAIPPNAARSVMVSHGAHGEGRGVARIASRSTIFQHNVSTWYGPGFYGRPFACSGRVEGVSRYWRNVRGTAHMSLPCGTRLLVCNRVNRRCVLVPVIDRGAFHPGNLDLTARTAMDLCACSKPYTMKTKWRRV